MKHWWTLTCEFAPLTNSEPSWQRWPLRIWSAREFKMEQALIAYQLSCTIYLNLVGVETIDQKNNGLHWRYKSQWYKYVFWMNGVNLLSCELPSKANKLMSLPPDHRPDRHIRDRKTKILKMSMQFHRCLDKFECIYFLLNKHCFIDISNDYFCNLAWSSAFLTIE